MPAQQRVVTRPPWKEEVFGSSAEEHGKRFWNVWCLTFLAVPVLCYFFIPNQANHICQCNNSRNLRLMKVQKEFRPSKLKQNSQRRNISSHRGLVFSCVVMYNA